MMVVVSPHLDDAVLSVGAALADMAARSDVMVVTVCSLVDDPQRIQEDHNALAIIGARAIHLGLPDAPLRGVPLTWAGLCGGHDDDEFAEQVITALHPVLVDATEVWGPCGIGGHIDHRAVRTALAAMGHHCQWEDRPYARQRGAGAAHWRRCGAVVLATHDGADDEDEGVHFTSLIEAPPLPPNAIPCHVRVDGIDFHRHRLPVTDATRLMRHRALQAYASQWPLLVGHADVQGWPWHDDAEMLWRPYDS